MGFHLFDLLSVAFIILMACGFIIRTYLKMRSNSCATLCNGCSGSKCSTRSFVTKAQPIKFYQKKISAVVQ